MTEQTPGKEFSATVDRIHDELVDHLVKTYTAPGQGNPLAVMFAAAKTCRSFLDARATMVANGDASRE